MHLFCSTLWMSDITSEGSNQRTEDIILVGLKRIYCINAYINAGLIKLGLDSTQKKQTKKTKQDLRYKL